MLNNNENSSLPTDVKVGETVTTGVSADVKTTAETKPSLIKAESKTKLLGALKECRQTINDCIAILAQNNIDPVKLGALKSNLDQISGINRSIMRFKTKSSNSIIKKDVKS